MNQKDIKKLEILSRKLSSGISNGELENKLIEDTKEYLDGIKSGSENDLETSEAYILFETEALLQWAKGNEKNAYELISSAFVLKGDEGLHTETGKSLLSNVEEPLVKSRIKIPMTTKTKLFYAAFIIIFPLITLIILALDGKYSGLDKLKAILWTLPIIGAFSVIIVFASAIGSN